jgi:hypothetical protein
MHWKVIWQGLRLEVDVDSLSYWEIGEISMFLIYPEDNSLQTKTQSV